jgi:hypothetical protein
MNICPQVPVAAHRDIKVNLELSGYKVIRLGDRVQLYQVTPWAAAWRIIYTFLYLYWQRQIPFVFVFVLAGGAALLAVEYNCWDPVQCAVHSAQCAALYCVYYRVLLYCIST